MSVLVKEFSKAAVAAIDNAFCIWIDFAFGAFTKVDRAAVKFADTF